MKTRNPVESTHQIPAPELFDNASFKESMRLPHDLGGEADGPMQIQERGQEPWELNTYVTCECLAWRGVWNTVEKHRRHADLGQLQYLSMPYYGRWLLAAARAMIDKQHVTLTELTSKMDELKQQPRPVAAAVASAADGSPARVTRGSEAPIPTYHHAERAKGVGDPQCYRGQAGGPPKFKVGDRLRVKDMQDLFYNQTPGYTRGATGVVELVCYESPPPEDEAWGHTDRAEWFYQLRFLQKDLWGDETPDANPNDTVQAEISERWLEPV